MRNASLLALLAGAACFTPTNISPTDGGCDGCKPADAGKPGMGEKGDGGGSPDGGADAGRPDGGVDAGLDAGRDAGGPLTGTVCPDPDGGILFEGFCNDFCAQRQAGSYEVPLAGVQVATLEPYSAAVSDAQGNYQICVPANTPFTLVYSKPGYATIYLAELSLSPAFPSNPAEGQMQLFCNSLVQSFATEDPLIVSSDAAVFGAVFSASMGPPCEPDAGFLGWTFQATMVDGGPGPGGPWPTGYVDDAEDIQVVSSTFAPGEALMFNIPPSVGYVSVTASNASLGAQCSTLDPFLGATGRIYVGPGTLGLYPWIVP